MQWKSDEYDEVPPDIDVEHSKNLGIIAMVISL